MLNMIKKTYKQQANKSHRVMIMKSPMKLMKMVEELKLENINLEDIHF